MNDIRTRHAELAVRLGVSNVDTRAPAVEADKEPATAASGGNTVPPAPVASRPEDPARANDDARRSVEQAVARLNDYVQSLQRDIRFSIDPESNQPVVRVVERDTQELIRQIPSETALKLARSLKELEGLGDSVGDAELRRVQLSEIALFRAQA